MSALVQILGCAAMLAAIMFAVAWAGMALIFMGVS